VRGRTEELARRGGGRIRYGFRPLETKRALNKTTTKVLVNPQTKEEKTRTEIERRRESGSELKEMESRVG
jgi:hypothetical protein